MSKWTPSARRMGRVSSWALVLLSLAGTLCTIGTLGPIADMCFQFLAIAGYARVYPVVSLRAIDHLR
jgi:hypothetical protein